VTEGDPLINLTTTRIGSAAVVTVEGELDLHTARTLMGTVDDTLTTPDLAAIVIDLSGVTFLASMGIRMLISTTRALSRKGGRLVMFGAGSGVWDVIETSALTEIIPHAGSENEALMLVS